MKEKIMRLKFVKDKKNDWYIDLPEWKGRRSALQMVAGADTLLDIMADGKKEVFVFASNVDFDGAECLELVKTCWFNGADYVIEYYDNAQIDLKVWLCDVTKFVLGEFPDKIYFAKLKH